MPSDLHFMPIYQKDWISSSTVGMMSVTAEGIYFRLCLVQWEDGILPIDCRKLQRLARATDQEWEMFTEFLDDVFPVVEEANGRQNPRVAIDRIDALDKIQVNRENGAKGGRPKTEPKPKQNPTVNPTETERLTQDKPNGYDSHNPNETQTEPISESESEPDISPQPPYGGPPKGSALDVIPGGLSDSPPDEPPKPAEEPKPVKAKHGNMPANWVGHAPPSLETVTDYLHERGWLDPGGEAENYLDHHLNAGWRYGKGKTPLLDWKGQIRTIERQRTETGHDPRKLPRGAEKSWTPMSIAQEIFGA